jgi:hypothetical protein
MERLICTGIQGEIRGAVFLNDGWMDEVKWKLGRISTG